METTTLPIPAEAPAGAVKLHRLFRAIKPGPRLKNTYAVMATLTAVNLRPGAEVADLARRLGFPAGTVHNHLGILIRDGLVDANKKHSGTGRTNVVKSYPVPTPEGRAALATLAAIVA